MTDSETPLTEADLKEIAWDQYQDFYDDPRGVHYFTIRDIVDHEDVRVLDYVAEAIDLGCDDAQDEREMRSREELFDAIGVPSDEQWQLTKEYE